jgi:hypothetical protein
MKNKKLQALVEEMLGAAAAEPVHGDEAAKEHTPELSNKDVLVGQHAEEVEEVIVEGEDMDGEESHVDEGEYDYEGDMAKSQLRTILDAAQELHDQLGDEDNLPEWVQSKITLAKEYIDTARDYMKSEGQESVQESYTEEELLELFEALNLDTHKYTFEYLAEELGFVNEAGLFDGLKRGFENHKAQKDAAKLAKAQMKAKLIKDRMKVGTAKRGSLQASELYNPTVKKARTEGKLKKKLDAIDTQVEVSEVKNDKVVEKENTGLAKQVKKTDSYTPSQVNASVEYTREELEALFETLNLDTAKYTFEYLAEELGFAAAEPIATSDAEPKVLKVSLANKEVYDKESHEQAEEVEEVLVEGKKIAKNISKAKTDLKPVLVEGMRGRPSFKSLRVAPKGSTVIDKNGKLENIKKLQKKG